MEEIVETSKKRWPKRIFLVFLCIAVFVIYIHKIEPSMITTKEYAIKSNEIPASFNGFKIAHFSDIHFGRTTNEKEVTTVVNKINEMKPDIVVFTGDLFDPYITLSENNKTFLSEELKKIKTNLGKYTILGDQDLSQEEAFTNIMKNAEFQILDKNIPIFYKGEIPIYLYGISSGQKIDENSLKIKEYQITLCHEPDIFDTIYKRSDLTLAGHSLGGLIALPFTNGLVKQEHTNNYISGKYEKENALLYVSNGIGTEKISIRFLNYPTIQLYRLYSNN